MPTRLLISYLSSAIRGNRRRRLLALLSVVGLALLALTMTVVSARRPYAFHGELFQPVHAAPDFTLTDQENGSFHLSNQRGQVVLMFFGYTFCPDVCPLELSKLVQARRILGAEAARVRFVFITVDPERDNPARLRQYLGYFSSEFVGLTGDQPSLEQVWRDYGVYVTREEQKNSAAGYLVAHSTWSYLVDPNGHLRLIYPMDVSAEDLAADIRAILREGT
jgi:protein SCO1/2